MDKEEINRFAKRKDECKLHKSNRFSGSFYLLRGASPASLTVLGEVTKEDCHIFRTSSSLQSFANDEHILMVIKQQAILSNDIHENPGPFFEKCYEIVKEFCDDEISNNSFYVRACVDQLKVNQAKSHPIPFPEDFLTDDKVDIWRQCELKIKRYQSDDTEFRKSLQNVWHFWFQALYKKELNKSNNASQKSANSEPRPTNSAGNKTKSVTSQAKIEHMSIPLKDQQGKHCGFYKYGRSSDGNKFFCLGNKCKNSKCVSEGVTRETLKSHAGKIHLTDIDFQAKTGKTIKKWLSCCSCSRSFSRKQTLNHHQKKYHPDIITTVVTHENQIQETQKTISQNSNMDCQKEVLPITFTVTTPVGTENTLNYQSDVVNTFSLSTYSADLEDLEDLLNQR